jgi:hypothetical protein
VIIKPELLTVCPPVLPCSVAGQKTKKKDRSFPGMPDGRYPVLKGDQKKYDSSKKRE